MTILPPRFPDVSLEKLEQDTNSLRNTLLNLYKDCMLNLHPNTNMCGDKK